MALYCCQYQNIRRNVLVNRDTKCWISWIRDVICNEHRLKPPNYVGSLLMVNGKVPMIFNFGSKALCSGAKIAPLWEIVRTGDANVSEGSQYLSYLKKKSCGPRFVLFKWNM